MTPFVVSDNFYNLVKEKKRHLPPKFLHTLSLAFIGPASEMEKRAGHFFYNSAFDLFPGFGV